MLNKKTTYTVGDFARWCGAKNPLSRQAARRVVRSVIHDSRKVGPGDIFVALAGEGDNDGHKYVNAAFAAGAAGALVARKGLRLVDTKWHDRCLVTSNPLGALQKGAACYRKELGLLVVGITGSNGKTTTRSFMTEVLGSALEVSGTVSNWNNHIGVPLSLLRLCEGDYAGIIEMGANHEGEIATLSAIARPDIAVITNIGYAHVGLFGGLAATTRAKMEIVQGLADNGFLMINGDDERLVKAARASGRELVLFGCSGRCDVRAENIVVTPDRTSFELDGHHYSLAAGGTHFVYSVLPALYLARRFGFEQTVAARAVAALAPAPMRGEIQKTKGATFLLDYYNANPSSMKSALELLSASAAAANRVAVLGDMRELGRYSRKLHEQLGEQVAATGVRLLIAVGEQAGIVASSAQAAGLLPEQVLSAANAVEAGKLLAKEVKRGDTVLLKGSRGIGLEKAFEQIAPRRVS